MQVKLGLHALMASSFADFTAIARRRVDGDAASYPSACYGLVLTISIGLTVLYRLTCYAKI
jgi:hypothetical protein